MKRVMAGMTAALVLASGVAGAQAWKKAWTDYGVKYSLDGCYRAADGLAVCTFSATSGEAEPLRRDFYFASQVMTDKAGRKIAPVWGAASASGQRIKPSQSDFLYVDLPPETTVKMTLAFPLAAQYSTATIELAGHTVADVPVVAPGAAKAAPTTGTAGNYDVRLVNCVTAPDNRTLNCQATLTPKK